MKRIEWLAAGALLLSLCGQAWSQTAGPIWKDTKDDKWLSGAPTDASRWSRLEFVLRGTDVQMNEIGDRYLKLYDALADKNYDLALYHWEKIRNGMQGAALKRPKRRDNAEAIFLNTTYEEVRKAFASKNEKTAWDGFQQARGACMACHGAEKMDWLNNQPMFRRTEAPPKK
jgi:hypothetical protein